MNSRVILFLIFVLIFSSESVKGQFINLQIRVEPELSAQVEQNLDFGSIISNSGEKNISLGDLNMGVFNVRMLTAQNVFVELLFPDNLISITPGNSAQIPINLEMAYSDNGINDSRYAVPIPAQGKLLVPPAENTIQQRSASDVWREIYLYVYGSIIVGNVPNGEYVGDVTIILNYD